MDLDFVSENAEKLPTTRQLPRRGFVPSRRSHAVRQTLRPQPGGNLACGFAGPEVSLAVGRQDRCLGKLV